MAVSFFAPASEISMKPPPADIARLRVRHSQREAGGDGGVHRIASRLQNVRTHLRRDLLLRRNHPMLGDDRVKPRFVSDHRGSRGVVRPLRINRRGRGRKGEQRGQGDNQGLSLQYRMHL